ncbi:ankyrin repeat domain-containing protein [Endozoicomonas lisbonensis]|uniref:Ankyrin repeat protein n=1 Tax=Endozoicomonas lisbonensis TaxID=3120522 RepID=A0ABV2SCN3_9GAMM
MISSAINAAGFVYAGNDVRDDNNNTGLWNSMAVSKTDTVTTACSVALVALGAYGCTLAARKINSACNDLFWKLGWTRVPSLFNACSEGNLEAVRFNLDRGVNINGAPHESGLFTPIGVASFAGNAEVVRLLLERGADVTGNHYGLDMGKEYAPIAIAANRGHQAVVKLLLDHGIETGDSTALCKAAAKGDVEAVADLLSHGMDANGTSTSTGFETPIWQAAIYGHLDVVRLLLDRGADVNARAHGGLTPICQAAAGGYFDVVKLLLDKGADVNGNAHINTSVEKSYSPIRAAVSNGELGVARLLLDAGALVDSETRSKAPNWFLLHEKEMPLQEATKKQINKLVKRNKIDDLPLPEPLKECLRED